VSRPPVAEVATLRVTLAAVSAALATTLCVQKGRFAVTA
jgi:hypothetical protein